MRLIFVKIIFILAIFCSCKDSKDKIYEISEDLSELSINHESEILVFKKINSLLDDKGIIIMLKIPEHQFDALWSLAKEKGYRSLLSDMKNQKLLDHWSFYGNEYVKKSNSALYRIVIYRENYVTFKDGRNENIISDYKIVIIDANTRSLFISALKL